MWTGVNRIAFREGRQAVGPLLRKTLQILVRTIQQILALTAPDHVLRDCASPRQHSRQLTPRPRERRGTGTKAELTADQTLRVPIISTPTPCSLEAAGCRSSPGKSARLRKEPASQQKSLRNGGWIPTMLRGQPTSATSPDHISSSSWSTTK